MSLDGDSWMDGGPGEPGHRFFSPGENPDLAPIAQMSGRALRRVIEQIDPDVLALALKGAEAQVVERVLRNVSAKNAARIREEIARPEPGVDERPLRLPPIEARQMLMETAYALERHGDITFNGPADDAIPPLDEETEAGLAAFHAPGSGAEEVVSVMAALAARAEQHGLLSLEPALERSPEGIFATGLRMLVDQAPWDEVELVLARRIDAILSAAERGREIAIEGALGIIEGLSEERMRMRLVAFLPDGEMDYERMPGARFSPSAQAAVDLIDLCLEIAALDAREGGEAALDRLKRTGGHPLLVKGVEWAIRGVAPGTAERLLARRGQAIMDRERRRLQCLAEGFSLVREGHPADFVREVLGGYLEDRA